MLLLILAITDPAKRDIVLKLYMDYRSQALSIANSIVHNPETAEDIMQEAIEEIAKKPDNLLYNTAKKNWPYYAVIIKNKSKNYVRDNKRIQLVDDYSSVEYAMAGRQENVDLAELIATRENLALADQELNKLPDSYKEILMLRYINDLSDEEISSALGISMTNVRVRIHRALKKLETRLTGGGICG